MSVINRLEVSNCINLDSYAPGDKEWTPHYPHLEMNFRGYSAAIKAANGTGKTTLTNAYNALTTRDSEMITKFRERMAPKRKGIWSHFRVELLYETPEANIGPQLFGQDALGESWVFGMHGYCEGEVRFYYYRGHLEDCPVAEKNGHKRTLVHNENFTAALKLLSDANINPLVMDWKKAIGRHIDEALSQKMLAYHKADGGDGTSNFFKVNSRSGEDYDTTFFYSHLAPETLVKCMGQYGEENEQGFEDTLLTSAKGVLDAKYRAQKEATKIEKLTFTHKTLASAKDYADSHRHAQENLAKEARAVLAEFHFLRGCVKGDVLPLLPTIMEHGSSQTQYVANGMVLQDGDWLFPDYLLSELTGSESKVINQLADRKKQLGHPLKRSQVIEIPCDLMIHRRKDKGKPGRAYNLLEALAICNAFERFAEGWTLHSTLRAINHAWDWRAGDGEHNVFRKLHQKSEKEIDELDLEIEKSESALREKTVLLQSLNGEIQAMDQAVSALSAMRQSGLFSKDELSSPGMTEVAVEQTRQDAKQELTALHDRYVALEDGRQAYARIDSEFRPQSAQEAHIALVNDEANAEQISSKAKKDQRDAKEKLRLTSEAKSKTEIELNSARGQKGEINVLAPHMEKYESLFPGEDPGVLSETVPNEQEQARMRRGELNNLIKSTVELAEKFLALASGVRQYHGLFNDEVPFGLAEKVALALNDAEHNAKGLSDKIEQTEGKLRSLTDGKAHFNRVLEQFGEGVNVATLERELEKQEKESTSVLSQLDESIKRLRSLADALAEFDRLYPDMSPTKIEGQREARRDIVTVDISRLISEQKMASKQIAELESVGTAAGRIASQVLNCVGGSPLLIHQAIGEMGLSQERKIAVMAHFSQVLHSPVYRKSNEAQLALECLVKAGIESPVFDFKGLEAFCVSGELSWADDQVKGLLVGVETLQVKAILDPSHIPVLIRELQNTIEGVEDKLAQLRDEQLDLSPDSERSKLIAEARKAADESSVATLGETRVKHDKATKRLAEIRINRSEETVQSIQLACRYIEAGGNETLKTQATLVDRLKADAHSLKQEMPEIRQRASKESLSAIQSMLDYVNLGGSDQQALNTENLKSLNEELSEIEKRLPSLESRYRQLAIILKAKEFVELGGWEKAGVLDREIDNLRKRIAELQEEMANVEKQVRAADEFFDKTNSELNRASTMKARWESDLNRAISFTDRGGVSFDATYEEKHDSAKESGEHADRRSRFYFSQAQQAADAENDPFFSDNKIKRRDELNTETKNLSIRISDCREDQGKARKDERKHRSAVDKADTAARAILAQWREVREITEELPVDQKADVGTSNMFVTDSQYSASELRDAFADERWEDAVEQLESLAENAAQFPLSHRRTAIKEQSKTCQKASKKLKNEVTAVLDKPDNSLSEGEREALANPKTEAELVESVLQLHRIIEKYLIESEQKLGFLQQDIEDQKERMMSSMSGFTDSMQENFDLLKRVMNSGGNGASVKISGVVIGTKGMSDTLDSLVQEIEFQRSRREDDKEAGRVVKENDKAFDIRLRETIRSEFYRAAFRAPKSSNASGPTVFFKHPQIGGGRYIRLEKKFSTGQYNALSLLILVKLADFTMQRDARNEYDGLVVSKARRVSSARTVMIDGLFSNLSDKKMIRESLSVLRSLKGSFQLIGWIHNQQYENDYELFPACISVRRTGINRGYVLAEDVEAAPLPETEEVAAIETHVSPMKHLEALDA